MHVAIVMVGFRNAEEIGEQLATIGRQTHQDFSFHVCENGGTAAYDALLAETTKRALQAPDVQPIAARPDIDQTAVTRLGGGQTVRIHRATGNLGYAGGINACLRSLAGDRWDAIWVLNPDAMPDPPALAVLIGKLQQGYGIVGGRLLIAETGRVQMDGGRWRRMIARGFNLGLGGDAGAAADVRAIEEAMDYVSGACMLVSRAFVDSVGLMDEEYFLYNEEVAWCARRGAFRLGFAPEAIVRHGHGTTIGSSSNRRQRSRLSVYLDERNKLLFTRRHHAAVYPLVMFTTLALTAQYLVEHAHTNFRHALAGWWAGVRGETGIPHWMRSAR